MEGRILCQQLPETFFRGGSKYERKRVNGQVSPPGLPPLRLKEALSLGKNRRELTWDKRTGRFTVAASPAGLC
jgi:hypothetical protein